jgi:hypothetical protein
MKFIGILGTIPQIIVVIAVVMYSVKRFTTEAVLLLIGATIGLITSVSYSVALPWLFGTYGSTWYESYIWIIAAIGTLGGLCFAIGLLLLVQNILKTRS